MRIYLAAPYSRKKTMKQWASLLESNGLRVVSEWVKRDDPPDAESALSPYSRNERAREWAVGDLNDILRADTLLLDATQDSTRGGKDVEFGIAYALHTIKRTWIIGPRRNVFHHLKAVRQFEHIVDAMESLKLIAERQAIIDMLAQRRKGDHNG